MFGYLILLFTLLPAIELAILIQVGTRIGVGNTLLLIIVTGVLGAYLARLQGFFVIRQIQSQLEKNIMPTEEMIDGLMIFAGGILLLTPGLVTDTLGFLLLIPLTRSLIKHLVKSNFTTHMKTYSNGHYSSAQDPRLHKKPRRNFEDANFHD